MPSVVSPQLCSHIVMHATDMLLQIQQKLLPPRNRR